MNEPYALFLDDSSHNLKGHSGRVIPIKVSLPKDIYHPETQQTEHSKFEEKYSRKKNFRKLYTSMKNIKEYNVYTNGGMNNTLMRRIIRYISNHPIKYIFLDWDFTIQRNNGTPLNKKADNAIKLSEIVREHHTNTRSYIEFIIGKTRLPVFKKMLVELKKRDIKIIILTANSIPSMKGGKKFMADVLNEIAQEKVMYPEDVYHSRDKQSKINELLQKYDEELYNQTHNLEKKLVVKARRDFYKPFTKTRKKTRNEEIA
jgi:hypothetical protein